MRPAELIRDISLIYQVNFRPLSPRDRLGGMARLATMYASKVYNAPISILIAVTGRCQCNCRHCGISYLNNEDELSYEAIVGVLDEYRALGGVRVIFSGGEPLLRDDLVPIVAHASRLGLTTFIDTNGIAMSDELARQLARAGLCNLEFSVDFLDERKMSENRRHDGALAAVLAAIEMARRHGLNFSINTVAFRESLGGDMQRMIRWARRVGALYIRVLEPISIGHFKTRDIVLTLHEREIYRALYEPGFVILEQVGEFTVDCSGLNGRFLSITPAGTVEPCPYMPISLGNIHEQSLAEIIRGLPRRARPVNDVACQCDPSTCPVNDPEFQRKFLSPAS